MLTEWVFFNDGCLLWTNNIWNWYIKHVKCNIWLSILELTSESSNNLQNDTMNTTKHTQDDKSDFQSPPISQSELNKVKYFSIVLLLMSLNKTFNGDIGKQRNLSMIKYRSSLLKISRQVMLWKLTKLHLTFTTCKVVFYGTVLICYKQKYVKVLISKWIFIMQTLRRQWILILFQVKYKTTKSTYCVIYLQPDVSIFVYIKCTAFTLRSLIVFIHYLTKCFSKENRRRW